MKYAYHHIASRLFGTPLAINPERLKGILDAVGNRIVTGETPHDERGMTLGETKAEAISKRLLGVVGGQIVDVGKGMGQYARSSGIAVIPVMGPLAQRFDFMAALCGFCTYDGLKETINAASQDQDVRGILFDIDSPGGETVGLFDLADYIRAMSDKPVWASANGMAASAAYALGASADKFYASQMSYVGSIGVVAVHVDYSERDKALGLKYSAIYSGEHKIDGWSHIALPKAVKDRWQEDIDDARDTFASVVGSYGRLTKEEALATEADVFRDKEAKKLKLVDGVKSFDDTLEAMQKLVSRSRPSNSARAASTQPKHDGNPNMNVQKVAAGDEPAVVQPAPAPAPAPAPTPPAVIPQNNAALDAAHAETTRIMAIVDMCALSGMPEKASEYIKAKTSAEDVRGALIKARADKVDQRPVDPSRGADAAANKANNYGWDAVIEAENARNGLKAQPAR